MNKKQKLTLLSGSLIILCAFIIWAAYGFELFTKTEVLVERTDELFGTTYKEWEDKFIWGLDYTLYVTGIVTVISAVMFFIFKKSKETK